MNASLKTLSYDMLQNSQQNNGLKMNIKELNRLINLLDQPMDDILAQLDNDSMSSSKSSPRDICQSMFFTSKSLTDTDGLRKHSLGSNATGCSSNNSGNHHSNNSIFSSNMLPRVNSASNTTTNRVNQDLDSLINSLSQYRMSQASSNQYDYNNGCGSDSYSGSEYLYSGQIVSGRPPAPPSVSTNQRAAANAATNDSHDNNWPLGNGHLPDHDEEDSSSLPLPLPSIPNCQFCQQPILGSSVAALDGFWHQEHFKCFNCHISLDNAVYYPDNNRPHCETCHINLYTDKCAYCQEPILDTSLTALNQQWHPEHFFCSLCQSPFDDDTGFHEYNGKPYCSGCYFENFGYRCAGCDNPITDSFLNALEKKWHEDCLVCKICKKKFINFNFRVLNNEPYCESDYFVAVGNVCGTCSKPITNASLVNALGRRYHLNCFQCYYCQKSLAKSSFKEHNNRAYCTICFNKLCPT